MKMQGPLLKIIQKFKTAIAEHKTKPGALGVQGLCECTVALSGCSVASGVFPTLWEGMRSGWSRSGAAANLGEAGISLGL